MLPRIISTGVRLWLHEYGVRVNWKVETVQGLILALALILPVFQTAPQLPALNMIHVDVSGLRTNNGQVMCSLYASGESFPKNDNKAMAHAKSAISNGEGVCEFIGIGPGRYAIAVFHDENSNGKLDANFLGIPREGVGASNNAKGHFGPPKYEDAAFQCTGGRIDMKIAVAYL